MLRELTFYAFQKPINEPMSAGTCESVSAFSKRSVTICNLESAKKISKMQSKHKNHQHATIHLSWKSQRRTALWMGSGVTDMATIAHRYKRILHVFVACSLLTVEKLRADFVRLITTFRDKNAGSLLSGQSSRILHVKRQTDVLGKCFILALPFLHPVLTRANCMERTGCQKYNFNKHASQSADCVLPELFANMSYETTIFILFFDKALPGKMGLIPRQKPHNKRLKQQDNFFRERKLNLPISYLINTKSQNIQRKKTQGFG